MKTMEKVFVSIEDLTGQSIPFQDNKSKFLDHEPFNSAGIGHSQLNELLLTLGYDRMELGFFRYLFGRRSTVNSYADFAEGIIKFRKHAMLMYGNVKFGFKKLSSLNEYELRNTLVFVRPVKEDNDLPPIPWTPG